MTEDDYLTLTLAERIKWLHGTDGPQGRMSHDKLGKIIGATRQTIINWEKKGVEPDDQMCERLAEFSGFQVGVFSRREAEELADVSNGLRLVRLEAMLERVLLALRDADIEIPDPALEPRSSPNEQPKEKP